MANSGHPRRRIETKCCTWVDLLDTVWCFNFRENRCRLRVSERFRLKSPISVPCLVAYTSPWTYKPQNNAIVCRILLKLVLVLLFNID